MAGVEARRSENPTCLHAWFPLLAKESFNCCQTPWPNLWSSDLIFGFFCLAITFHIQVMEKYGIAMCYFSI